MAQDARRWKQSEQSAQSDGQGQSQSQSQSLEADFVDFTYPVPLFVQNTFIGANPGRPASLEAFIEDRFAVSCPASRAASGSGCESGGPLSGLGIDPLKVGSTKVPYFPGEVLSRAAAIDRTTGRSGAKVGATGSGRSVQGTGSGVSMAVGDGALGSGVGLGVNTATCSSAATTSVASPVNVSPCLTVGGGGSGSGSGSAAGPCTPLSEARLLGRTVAPPSTRFFGMTKMFESWGSSFLPSLVASSESKAVHSAAAAAAAAAAAGAGAGGREEAPAQGEVDAAAEESSENVAVVADVAEVDRAGEPSRQQQQQQEQQQKPLPSVGSAGHYDGSCKPCAFFHTKGCAGGSECNFCHLCEKGEKQRRQKEKRIFFGTMRQMLRQQELEEQQQQQQQLQQAQPGQPKEQR